MVYQDGELTSLNSLTNGVIRSGQIAFARANWAGEIDLVVLKSGSATVVYGRVVGETVEEYGKYVDYYGVEYGNGLRTQTTRIVYNGIGYGEYVTATLKQGSGGLVISGMSRLTALPNVSSASWTGTTSVLVAGRSYTVPSNVQCYNRDSKTWVTLEEAQKYFDGQRSLEDTVSSIQGKARMYVAEQMS